MFVLTFTVPKLNFDVFSRFSLALSVSLWLSALRARIVPWLRRAAQTGLQTNMEDLGQPQMCFLTGALLKKVREGIRRAGGAGFDACLCST